MNNYEYITAGLPELFADAGTDHLPDPEEIVAGIKEQCSLKDTESVDFLLSSFEPDNLCPEMYSKALGHREKFIRNYFLFDLRVRNAKARWLNKALERPGEQDVIHLEEEERAGEFPEESLVAEVLSTSDLLEREKALDRLYWNKVDEMTLLEIFSLDIILAFLVKLQITGRWMRLDPETGKRMLRQLTENLKNTELI